MNVEAQHRTYADLHEHLDRLDRAGLLYRIDAPVNKDTEMHPLVRWQIPRWHRGKRPEGVPVQQHRRLDGPPLRYSRRDRGDCDQSRDLPDRHECRPD